MSARPRIGWPVQRRFRRGPCRLRRAAIARQELRPEGVKLGATCGSENRLSPYW